MTRNPDHQRQQKDEEKRAESEFGPVFQDAAEELGLVYGRAACGEPKESLGSILTTLTQINESITNALAPLEADLQQFLLGLAGRSWETLEETQTVIGRIQSLLNRLGMRVACPKDGCGEPAILRCGQPGRSRVPQFRFEHFVDGRKIIHLCGTTLPVLRLVAPPIDKRHREPKEVF